MCKNETIKTGIIYALSGVAVGIIGIVKIHFKNKRAYVVFYCCRIKSKMICFFFLKNKL